MGDQREKTVCRVDLINSCELTNYSGAPCGEDPQQQCGSDIVMQKECGKQNSRDRKNC